MKKGNIPDIAEVRKVVDEWVKHNPRISKIYLFGSYVKRTKKIPSDIDIAIEIVDTENDSALGFWCSEKTKMEDCLSRLLNYSVDLEMLDSGTRIIKKGLEEGSILLYER